MFKGESMKPNRTVIIAFLAVLLPAAVFAGGGKDEPEYEAAEGMENWDHTFDVSGYEEGTYNLLIRGVDRAGNVTYGGPYNVKIDPASDLPVTRISNPSSGMRVGTNLNIVGTAVDDDGIGRVEVRIDDGPWVRADGTEFWSTYLDTARLAEGPHVVTARAIDINGKEGLETSVTFHFDRAKPRISVTSHRSGMLLSGKAELSGTVEDDNGVVSLSYSRDGGETYRPLKLDLDKETGIYAFSVKVDTADLEDGPTVYWFRGVDGTGSVGNSAFLFFVDNEGPELTILSPSSDEIVNGVVTVTGMVTDAVGVKSLAYVENGTPVEIPLVPGNPYWTIPIDFTTYKTKSADAEFVVEDLTGNVVGLKHKITLSNDQDVPGAFITFPHAGSAVSNPILLAGYATDDDGIL